MPYDQFRSIYGPDTHLCSPELIFFKISFELEIIVFCFISNLLICRIESSESKAGTLKKS